MRPLDNNALQPGAFSEPYQEEATDQRSERGYRRRTARSFAPNEDSAPPFPQQMGQPYPPGAYYANPYPGQSAPQAPAYAPYPAAWPNNHSIPTAGQLPQGMEPWQTGGVAQQPYAPSYPYGQPPYHPAVQHAPAYGVPPQSWQAPHWDAEATSSAPAQPSYTSVYRETPPYAAPVQGNPSSHWQPDPWASERPAFSEASPSPHYEQLPIRSAPSSTQNAEPVHGHHPVDSTPPPAARYEGSPTTAFPHWSASSDPEFPTQVQRQQNASFASLPQNNTSVTSHMINDPSPIQQTDFPAASSMTEVSPPSNATAPQSSMPVHQPPVSSLNDALRATDTPQEEATPPAIPLPFEVPSSESSLDSSSTSQDELSTSSQPAVAPSEPSIPQEEPVQSEAAQSKTQPEQALSDAPLTMDTPPSLENVEPCSSSSQSSEQSVSTVSQPASNQNQETVESIDDQEMPKASWQRPSARAQKHTSSPAVATESIPPSFVEAEPSNELQSTGGWRRTPHAEVPPAFSATQHSEAPVHDSSSAVLDWKEEEASVREAVGQNLWQSAENNLLTNSRWPVQNTPPAQPQWQEEAMSLPPHPQEATSQWAPQNSPPLDPQWHEETVPNETTSWKTEAPAPPAMIMNDADDDSGRFEAIPPQQPLPSPATVSTQEDVDNEAEPPRTGLIIFLVLVLIASTAGAIFFTGMADSLLQQVGIPTWDQLMSQSDAATGGIPAIFGNQQADSDSSAEVRTVSGQGLARLWDFTVSSTSSKAPVTLTFTLYSNDAVENIRLYNTSGVALVGDMKQSPYQGDGKIWQFSYHFAEPYTGEVGAYYNDGNDWYNSELSCTVDVQ